MHRAGRLTREQWEQQLKALILRDLKGRYWTIGAQTGKWYYYDGMKWVEGAPQSSAFVETGPTQVAQAQVPTPAPPPQQPVVCAHCGFENAGGRALCSRCGKELRKDIRSAVTPRDLNTCASCGARLEAYLAQCPRCGADVGTRALSSTPLPGMEARLDELELRRGPRSGADFIEMSTGAGLGGDESEIRALNLWSCFRFWGGAGLIIGLVCGVFFGGIKDIGQGLAPFIPLMQLKGRWSGGLLFGLIGALGFGVFSGLYGVFLGFLYNLLAIIFGGIKIKVFRIPS